MDGMNWTEYKLGRRLNSQWMPDLSGAEPWKLFKEKKSNESSEALRSESFFY